MPNSIRSLIGRLRGAVIDRRRAPRYNVRLFFSVSILDEKASNDGGQPSQTLVGRTRIMSESGFALIVPSLRIGTAYLHDNSATLRLMLDLPKEKTEIYVSPVRSFELDEKDPDSGYFIGAKITHMSDEARSRYMKFLRTLG